MRRNANLSIAEARKLGILPPDAKQKRGVSGLEECFAALWRQYGNGMEPEREYRFIEGRRYRADFAWKEQRLAVELDGFSSHVHKYNKRHDSERDRLAVLAGWRVLRYVPSDLRMRPLQCIEEVVRALNQ